MAWYPFQNLSNDYKGIGPVSEADVQGFFEGSDFEPEAIPHWIPRHVKFWNDRRKTGDFPGFGRLPPVLNRRALEALRPLLVNCDILPLNCPEEPLVAINPPILTGALDPSDSVVDWFEEQEGVSALTIHRYVFRGEQVRHQPLFRLAERRLEPIVSDVFREAVEKHGLKGLQFLPLDATWKP